MPSTPFAKLWEQMCLAYDSGIRDVWILNTGDLKGNEVSLHQFLDLAYDYDKWTEDVIIDLYDMNGRRRPEALNAKVYHPCHEKIPFDNAAEGLLESTWTIMERIQGTPAADAYYSMVHLPAISSLNLLDMHLSAGRNAHYAAQGRAVANEYADRVDACMKKDAELCAEYAAFRGGKWSGMEQEAHIGFTSWNEDGCRMPLRTYVYPWKHPRLSASRKDDARIYGRVYGKPMTIVVDDFCDAGVDRVMLEIANAGQGVLTWRIEGSAPWLTISDRSGKLSEYPGTDLDYMALDCDRSLLTEEVQHCQLSIIADDATVNVAVSARKHPANEQPAYMPVKKVVTIEAPHFCEKHDVPGAAFRVLPGYGRSGGAVKVYPNMAAFAPEADAPSLTYRFLAEKAGGSPAGRDYTCELWLTSTSPVQPGTPMRCTLTGPDGVKQLLTCVPADYKAGNFTDPRWSQAMLDHIRKVKTTIRCEYGLNEITIGAVDPNLILERILIYPADHVMPESYLGPAESPCL